MSAQANVGSFILPGRVWNQSLFQATFLPFEANSVLNIPLGWTSGEDTRYWRYEAKGLYTVRSGYRQAIGSHESLGNHSYFSEES